MTIRPINDGDYPMLLAWWAGHKAVPLPKHILPRGWIIEDGVPFAASFLLIDAGGKIAVIEFLTTNPAISLNRHLVEHVKTLVAYVEDQARALECTFMMSFIAPGSGEERLMGRLGYENAGGPPHKMYAKPLGPKET